MKIKYILFASFVALGSYSEFIINLPNIENDENNKNVIG